LASPLARTAEATARSSWSRSNCTARAPDRLSRGAEYASSAFITGRIALEDLVEPGFDTLINHKDTAVKVLVHP
jgi:hypothetical protein